MPADAPASHTRALAEWVAGFRYEDMEPGLVAATKGLLIDTLGCIVAARATAIGPVVERLSGHLAAGPQSTLSTAYALGRLGNALDLDEGVPAGTHFGCGAVGAAMAIAAGRPVGGRDFLAALCLGYETGGRIGDAIGPYFRTEAGAAKSFAQVWGAMTPVVFAAAAAAARLEGHDANLVAQTFGHAGASTPVPIGAKWAQETAPPNTKYGDTGWCTLAGVFGAIAAGAGSTGIGTMLEGDDGLYAMVAAQDPHPEIVAADLGTRWRIRQILYKRWPCCRWIHYPLTALTGLMRERAFAAEEVQHVRVRIGFAATSHRFVTQKPASFAGYQFSIPHAVAMVLLDIPPGPAWFEPQVAEHPRVKALRERVEVVRHDRDWEFSDLRFVADGPVRRLPGAVEVTTARGAWQAESDFAFGDSYAPEMRWDETDIEAKFRSLVGEPAASRILTTIGRMEELEDVRVLHTLLAEAVPPAHAAAALGRLERDRRENA